MIKLKHKTKPVYYVRSYEKNFNIQHWFINKRNWNAGWVFLLPSTRLEFQMKIEPENPEHTQVENKRILGTLTRPLSR